MEENVKKKKKGRRRARLAGGRADRLGRRWNADACKHGNCSYRIVEQKIVASGAVQRVAAHLFCRNDCNWKRPWVDLILGPFGVFCRSPRKPVVIEHKKHLSLLQPDSCKPYRWQLHVNTELKTGSLYLPAFLVDIAHSSSARTKKHSAQRCVHHWLFIRPSDS